MYELEVSEGGTPPRQTRRKIKSSELSRNPGEVFAAADAGPIEITRRDGESLLLARLSQVIGQEEGLGLASDVMAVAVQAGESMEQRALSRFPWLLFLSERDRRACMKQLIDLTLACAAVAQFAPLVQLHRSWKETAAALAEGLGGGSQDWLDEPLPAVDPRAT